VPYPTFFRQCAGRGNLLPTVFTFKEFLLNVLACWGIQGGLLDGDPAKEAY
jgi:hypothetical protein